MRTLCAGEPSVVPGWVGHTTGAFGRNCVHRQACYASASQAGMSPGEKKRPSCSHADGDAKKTRERSRVASPGSSPDGEGVSLARAVWSTGVSERGTQLGPHQAVVRGRKRRDRSSESSSSRVGQKTPASTCADIGRDVGRCADSPAEDCRRSRPYRGGCVRFVLKLLRRLPARSVPCRRSAGW